jgi:hypothetical protein
LIINSELFAYIDSDDLKRILNNNISLKNLVDLEVEKADNDTAVGSGHKCGGCGSGCSGDSTCCGSSNELSGDTLYLTSALMSVFNFYIPEDIKNAIHLGGTTFIDNVQSN